MFPCRAGMCYSVRSASIGESDDAFTAGYNPNKIPIIAENDTEIKTHCVEITAGHSGTILAILTARTAIPSPANIPNPIPIAPPTLHIIMASIRNCTRISRLFCAECFSEPDLARPLTHGDEHHVHNPDATDEKRKTRDASQGDFNHFTDFF